jgi:branched-chain amino acid transport system substrate-binding protein
MKKNHVVMLLVVLALTLSACGGPGPTKGEVIVYVAAPLSGFQANGGQTVLGGARLAADEANKSGGLLGYKIVVVGKDDESTDDVAVAVAKDVAADIQAGKRVLGVVGHYNSGQTLAAMEIYKDLPIVIITPTSSEATLTQKGYKNFFRVNANDSAQASVDAAFLVNKLMAKKVAIVHNDDPYGIGLGKALADQLGKLGAQAVLNLQVQVGQSKYITEVQEIKTAAPDAVFYAGYEVETPYLRKQLVDAGVQSPFMASDGAFLSPTIDEAEGTAEGIYLSNFAPEPRVAMQAQWSQWLKAYQDVEYRDPDTYSINGYSAMKVLLEGAKKAGTLEGPKVADAIRSLDITTPIGKVAYDPNGDLKEQRIFIFQVKDGAFVQVSQ